MAHIGIVQAQLLHKVETSIKDDLAHLPHIHDLPINSIYTLDALYTMDNQRPTDLATAIGTPPTSFTPILDRLEALGLIQRVPNANDRRAIIVCLTKEGKKYETAIVNAIGNAEVKYGSK